MISNHNFLSSRQDIFVKDNHISQSPIVFILLGGFTGPLNYYRMLFEIPKVKPVRMQMTMPSIIIWGVDDRAL